MQTTATITPQTLGCSQPPNTPWFFLLVFQSSSRERRQRVLLAATNMSCSAAPEVVEGPLREEESSWCNRDGDAKLVRAFDHQMVISKQPRGKITQK